MSYGIEPDEEGSVGLRLTARGSVTTCTYHVDTDGRTHFTTRKRAIDGMATNGAPVMWCSIAISNILLVAHLVCGASLVVLIKT